MITVYKGGILYPGGNFVPFSQINSINIDGDHIIINAHSTTKARRDHHNQFQDESQVSLGASATAVQGKIITLYNFFAEPSTGGSEPLYTYTHSGNKVVNITAVDYATGVFTATAHGLTSTIASNDGNNRLFLVFKTDNLTVDLAPTIPMTDSSPASSSSDKGYYIRVIDADTFKLALAYAGADLVLTDKGTIDFTKWHFEQSLVSDLMTFSGIGGALEIDVILNGQWGNSVRYMSQINGVTSFLGLFNRLGGETGNTTNLGDGMKMDFGVALYNGTQILNLKKDKQGFTLNASQKSFDIGSTSLRGKNKMSNGFTPSAETSINSITLSRMAISNGTTIRIFKKS